MTGGARPITWRASGSGPTVLLLNGGMMSLGAWEPIAAPLERAYRVLRCDFRGQLLSPGDPPPSIDGHVEDVRGVLDAAGVDRAHVVGASYGGFVALALAAASPGRVASLVALTTAERVTSEAADGTRVLRDAARAAADGGDGGAVFDLLASTAFSDAYVAANADVLGARRAAVAALPPAWFRGLAGLLEALLALDLRPRLGAIRCPTLVVAAGLDRTFPLERSRALADAIPGARLAVVEDAGHAAIVEAPERVVAVVTSFLEAVGGRARGTQEGRP